MLYNIEYNSLFQGKLRWLNEELKVRISSERRLREQVDYNNRRIMVGYQTIFLSTQTHRTKGWTLDIRGVGARFLCRIFFLPSRLWVFFF